MNACWQKWWPSWSESCGTTMWLEWTRALWCHMAKPAFWGEYNKKGNYVDTTSFTILSLQTNVLLIIKKVNSNIQLQSCQNLPTKFITISICKFYIVKLVAPLLFSVMKSILFFFFPNDEDFVYNFLNKAIGLNIMEKKTVYRIRKAKANVSFYVLSGRHLWIMKDNNGEMEVSHDSLRETYPFLITVWKAS